MAHLSLTTAPLVVLAALAGACGGSDESVATHTAMADCGESCGTGRAPGFERDDRETNRRRQPHHRSDLSVRTSGYGLRLGGDLGHQRGRITSRRRGGFRPARSSSSRPEPVRPAGENTAFQLSQPKGLKPGTYKVVLFLGDDSVDTKVFVVKK